MILDSALAFLAGLLSFASTCVLPLVPAYVAYMGAAATGTEMTVRRQHRHGRAGRRAAGVLFGRPRPSLPDRGRTVRGVDPDAGSRTRRLCNPECGGGRLPDRHGGADLLQPADPLQRLLSGGGGNHAVGLALPEHRAEPAGDPGGGPGGQAGAELRAEGSRWTSGVAFRPRREAGPDHLLGDLVH